MRDLGGSGLPDTSYYETGDSDLNNVINGDNQELGGDSGTGDGGESNESNENNENNKNTTDTNTGGGTAEEPAGEVTGFQAVIQKVEDFVTSNYAAFGGICVGAGVTVALIVTLIVMLIRRLARRGRRRGDAPAMKVRVEKLHEQGARQNQQDCFAVSPTEFADKQGVLAVVADGMGGLQHGEQVSQAAVSAALNGFFTATGSHEQVLLDLLGKAVAAVDDLLGPDGLKRSGSTMVMGLLRDGLFHFVSVGDSRICLYRDGELYKLNREHTYRAELAAKAVSGYVRIREVYDHPKAGSLTSYLGMGEIKYVDMPVSSIPVHAGDRLVLMTDGVYNAVTDGELATALSRKATADTLRSLVSSKGYTNQDNYTAVILTVEDGASGRRK